MEVLSIAYIFFSDSYYFAKSMKFLTKAKLHIRENRNSYSVLSRIYRENIGPKETSYTPRLYYFLFRMRHVDVSKTKDPIALHAAQLVSYMNTHLETILTYAKYFGKV
ncbi:hypothetical protein C2G38_2309593 [Gigaspora rosea]|uniref:Uncharacterized protein n=1 Tax=Gigaspora rosea TaxID=44941 RepID=A0A397VBJ1_9GLOM|nr:hypothetical protein C2G38_2309593 [Gigaspora rosea]